MKKNEKNKFETQSIATKMLKEKNSYIYIYIIKKKVGKTRFKPTRVKMQSF